MNRTDRLVAIVLFLQGRRLVRAADLAGRFEISERTVYRDIAALGEAGVPIAGEAGVGYSLMKGYHLPPVMFTGDEASALFVGGEMVRQFTDASLHAPTNSALEKLRAVLPPDRQDYVDRLARQTVIAAPAAGSGPDPAAPPWLLTVQQGVAQRRVLRMTYHGRDRDEDTCRDAEPLGIVFYSGAWSMVAWCRLRRDIWHFRIDRIRRLELLAERFSPRPDFSLARHLAANVAKAAIDSRTGVAGRTVAGTGTTGKLRHAGGGAPARWRRGVFRDHVLARVDGAMDLVVRQRSGGAGPGPSAGIGPASGGGNCRATRRVTEAANGGAGFMPAMFRARTFVFRSGWQIGDIDLSLVAGINPNAVPS